MLDTPHFIVIVVAVCLAWEAYVLIARKKGWTISEAFWEWCGRFPYVPFFGGLLCGHLFWQAPEVYREYVSSTPCVGTSTAPTAPLVTR